MQYYFGGGVKVTGISHDGYHVGMFRKMLNLITDERLKRQPLTVVVTVNMRTFGPAATFSANEASNQQEAVFYSRRLPLVNRVYVSLHHYDNRNAMEMEREKSRWWRSQDLRFSQGKLTGESEIVAFQGMENIPNTRSWIELMAGKNYDLPSEVRNMADAYIKEFAWVMDDQNPRLNELKGMVDACKERNINLVCLILMPNRAHAESILGDQLAQYIDYNLAFLRDRLEQWQKAWDAKTGDCATGVSTLRVVDIPALYEKAYGGFAGGEHYTDQYYPTEHVDAHLRGFIAAAVAKTVGEDANLHYVFAKDIGDKKLLNNCEIAHQWQGKSADDLGFNVLVPAKNNMPNFAIKMPYADSLLRIWQEKRQ